MAAKQVACPVELGSYEIKLILMLHAIVITMIYRISTLLATPSAVALGIINFYEVKFQERSVWEF